MPSSLFILSFVIKIFFPYLFRLCYLFDRCFLRFLDNAVRGDDKRTLFRVPKGKQPVLNTVEQSPQFPYLRIFQLLVQFFLQDSILYLMQIIHNFLICLSRKRIHKGIRLFHQHHFKFHQPCFYLYPGANIAFVSIKRNNRGNFSRATISRRLT